MMKSTKKGFTLVELLVVIAILAILATVSVVGYTSFIDKANQSVAMQEMTQIRNALVAEDINNPNFNLEDGIDMELDDEMAFAADGEVSGRLPEYLYVEEFVDSLGMPGKFRVVNGLCQYSPDGKDATATWDVVNDTITTETGAIEDNDQSTEPVEPIPPVCNHENATDDGDCTTAVVCGTCKETVVEAKAHVAPETGIQDCTVDIKCANEDCDYVIREGKEKHTLGEDDKCANCGIACQVTITFDDTSKRTSCTTETQVWVENGITVTNNKGDSTSDVADYSEPARFYVNTKLTIAFDGMVRIEFNCNTADFASALMGSNIENATVVQSGKTVIVTFAEKTKSFTIEKLSAQVHVDSITVHIDYACEHANTTTTAVDPTCTEAGYTLATCSLCGLVTKTEGEGATGHTPVIDEAVEAGCTSTGLTEGKHCDVCDEVLVEQETIPATGHNYVDGQCVCGAEESALVETTYTYEFTSSQFTANGTKTLGDVAWTLAGDGGFWGYDATLGQHLGSGSKPYKTLTFTSESFDNVSKITINTSGGSNTNAKLTVTVGGTQIGETVTLTSSATDYTFISETPLTGEIVLSYTQTSSKAIYIKSIAVTYMGEAQEGEGGGEAEHTCESVCTTCGECTDTACTETACAEKCEGHNEPVEPATTKTVTLQYTGGTTTNMTGNNDAAKVGLDASIWSVTSKKGASQNHIGLNKNGELRMYYGAGGDGNELHVELISGTKINTIKLTISGTYTVYVNGEEVTAKDGVYTINANSFTIKNTKTTNTQAVITSIDITFEP